MTKQRGNKVTVLSNIKYEVLRSTEERIVVMEWHVQWLLWNNLYHGLYWMVCTLFFYVISFTIVPYAVVMEWDVPWLLMNIMYNVFFYGITWTMVVMEWYVQWLLWNDLYHGLYWMICSMVFM